MSRIHYYGLPFRPGVMVLLGVLGVLCAYLLHWAETVICELPWWFDAPASVGFAMALYKLLDKHLWHRRFIIDHLCVPDLRGVWLGELRSSYDNFDKAREVKVEIFQTWTAMFVTLENVETGTRSRSLGGYIVDVGDGSFELVYTFQNEPAKSETGPLQIHQGTTLLRLSKDRTRLDGHYYTGRERMNHGTLALVRAVDT